MTISTATTALSLLVMLSDTNSIGWPCRCGTVHRGAYAIEDRNHHMCLHVVDLVLSPLPDGSFLAICGDCGMSWRAVLLP